MTFDGTIREYSTEWRVSSNRLLTQVNYQRIVNNLSLSHNYRKVVRRIGLLKEDSVQW